MTFDPAWVEEALSASLKWQLANPDADPRECNPPVPPAGLRIWQVFLELHATRAAGFGPAPIGMPQIESYCAVRRVVLRGFEIDWILALDRIVLDHAATRQARETAPPKMDVSTRPLSPQLFDAMFH